MGEIKFMNALVKTVGLGTFIIDTSLVQQMTAKWNDGYNLYQMQYYILVSLYWDIVVDESKNPVCKVALSCKLKL